MRRGFLIVGGRANLIKKVLFARGPGQPDLLFLSDRQNRALLAGGPSLNIQPDYSPTTAVQGRAVIFVPIRMTLLPV